MFELTHEQIEAINKIKGKVCLKAGAGTGKTFVLTNRYIRVFKTLLKKGYKLEDALFRIVAVTFTNKAANQMRARIKENLSDVLNLESVLSNAYISTIDAFCVRLLKENAFQTGLDPDFVIIDEVESKLLFLKEARIVFNTQNLPLISLNVSIVSFLNNVYSFIRRLKNNAITPSIFKKSIENLCNPDKKKSLGEVIFCLYSAYEERLKRENKFDFQRILLEGLTLLENKVIREKYKDFFEYILVDEYQDTTFLQDRLLRELASYSGNYFVVGDINQSIYAFRDARPENMIDFDKEAKEKGLSLSLTTNFRSFEELLEINNQCFQKQMPYFESLHSGKNKQAICGEFYLARDAKEEAEFIAQRILYLLENDKRSDLFEENKPVPLQCKDIAILFRNIKNISVYEETLYKHQLPFITIGGTGFYARPEIRDIISLLSIINNPFDDISLVRILKGPLYRISNSTLQKLANLKPYKEIEDEEKDVIKKETYPLYDALEKVDGLNISDEEKTSLERLRKFIDESIFKKNEVSLAYFLYDLIRKSGYINYIQTLSPIERQRSMANIDKFYQLVSQFEEKNLFPVLEDFIFYLKEITRQETVESEERYGVEDVIQLMTIHQAKGLEFPVVFVANISPYNFPAKVRFPKYYFDPEEGFLYGDDKEEKEKINKKYRKHFVPEEERLLYVAMTRAKVKLILSGIVKEDRKKTIQKSRFMDYFFESQNRKLALKEKYTTLLVDAGKLFPIKEEWKDKKYKKALSSEEPKIDIEEVSHYLDFKYSSGKTKNLKKSFNVTELAVFENCPLQYKYRYVMGILLDDIEGDVGEEKMDRSAFGMVMHKMLQEFVLFKEQKKWDEEKIFSRFKRLAKAYGIAEENIKYLYSSQVQKILNNFLESDYNPYKNKEKVKIVEGNFHLNLKGFLIKGTIDRIDYIGKGCFEISDYKTTESINIDKYNLSMQLYKIGAEKVLGFTPVTKLTLYYLRHGKAVSLKIEDSQDILRKVEEIISQINQGNYNVSKKGGKDCTFCKFKTICEAR